MAERFHVPDLQAAPGGLVELDSAESHHALRVMRMRVGDAIRVFGGGREFEGVIEEADKKRVAVRVGTAIVPPAQAIIEITCVLPWLRGGKSESLVQKLTELGVDALLFYSARRETAHSESAREERLHRVAVDAAKQCERADVPRIVCGGESLSLVVERISIPCEWIILLVERSGGSAPILSDWMRKLARNVDAARATTRERMAIISGPEGGFDPEEIEQLRERVTAVSLGQRILRAETAPVAAVCVALAAGGDL